MELYEMIKSSEDLSLLAVIPSASVAAFMEPYTVPVDLCRTRFDLDRFRGPSSGDESGVEGGVLGSSLSRARMFLILMTWASPLSSTIKNLGYFPFMGARG
ncbi:hypothetical protein ATCV1_z703L [Acanthocystis turfacea chlorella virus 1]|uniref:Uncharacterized protein z703L n=1 Tax=Chlorovirus heliozoae TaxID=322019 RepID=A7K9W3_9PHYC|nr:hypothetical protein ATCV1_z703L [Acanthocystis turfacea chlorella virus 1]ABT16837.1 hypothetical protein ATCV1_z703L [Acanthocystis turfacea chlorella virus 1]